MDLDQPENSNISKIIKDTLTEDKLHVCFGGGVGSFGRNFTIFYFNKITLWIDVGCGFPSANLPGLQRTIPAKELLETFQPDAIILTHAHEDHIGAIPYIVANIRENTPLYASDFTIAIIKKRLRDMKINPDFFRYVSLSKNTQVQIHHFLVNIFFIPHSIPQSFSVGLYIQKIDFKFYFTSDFKTEGTESNYSETDIKNYGPVDILFCDSTGSLHVGSSSNENIVRKNLEQIVKDWGGRIFFTTFASQIERLEYIGQVAKKYGRKIGIRGQSIITHMEAAMEAKIVKDAFWYARKPEPEDKNTLWIISGCQADNGSSFFRFADGKLDPLYPQAGDLVIYSASVIPANTEPVFEVMNKLARKGLKIIGLADYDPKVHTSGHARADDLKRMISYLRPKTLIPIHGDHIHFMGLQEIIGNSGEIQLQILDDNCIYSLKNGINEVMRIPSIPQMIEEGEIHTEYSLYSYRLNLSISGICNLIIREDTKILEQIQYIGTSSQEWLKKCQPELTRKIQDLIIKLYDNNNNLRDRKLKQKIAKVNVSILGKNPYVNIIWI